jgi:hypothetical protein
MLFMACKTAIFDLLSTVATWFLGSSWQTGACTSRGRVNPETRQCIWMLTQCFNHRNNLSFCMYILVIAKLFWWLMHCVHIQIHCQISGFSHPLDAHAPCSLPTVEESRRTAWQIANMAVLQVMNSKYQCGLALKTSTGARNIWCLNAHRHTHNSSISRVVLPSSAACITPD